MNERDIAYIKRLIDNLVHTNKFEHRVIIGEILAKRLNYLAKKAKEEDIDRMVRTSIHLVQADNAIDKLEQVIKGYREVWKWNQPN